MSSLLFVCSAAFLIVSGRLPAPEACGGGLVPVAHGDARYDRPVLPFRLAFHVEAETPALDTIWPVVTGSGPMLDTTRVIPLTADPDGDAYFRTAIIITFEDGVSNAVKAAFFARHSITVLGVSRANFYYVQIPDPGMDIQAFYAAIDSLRAESETRGVLPIVFRGMRLIGLAPSPDDETPALDTIWPVVTGNFPMLDSTRVVAQSDEPGATVYFRTEFTIVFEPGVPAAARAAFFRRHSVTVLGVDWPASGGDDGDFYVRVPDPGPSIEAYHALKDTLRAAPEVRLVLPLFRSGGFRRGVMTYGALSLLSNERKGTPLRGVRVPWDAATAHDALRVVAQLNCNNRRVVPIRE